MSGARTVKVHARRGQVADFHRFLTPGMLNRPKCSTMACRHGQSTDLARHRTAERSRRAGPGLRFERCPGRRSLLLRRRSVLGLLCAARGRLGVGPVSPDHGTAIKRRTSSLRRGHASLSGVAAPGRWQATRCLAFAGNFRKRSAFRGGFAPMFRQRRTAAPASLAAVADHAATIASPSIAAPALARMLGGAVPEPTAAPAISQQLALSAGPGGRNNA